MIAGTYDAIVPDLQHAESPTEKNSQAGLLVLDGGTHTGFANIPNFMFRFVHNPDELACRYLNDFSETRGSSGAFVRMIIRRALGVCRVVSRPRW